MKLNRNICLIVLFLVVILLYCCLGTSNLEGLVATRDKTSTPALGSQKLGVESTQLNNIAPLKLDYINNPKGFINNAQSAISKDYLPSNKPADSENKNGINSTAREVQNAGERHANEMKREQAARDNLDGTGCPPGYHKNKDNICSLSPDNYNNTCDTGFVWDKVSKSCERPRGVDNNKNLNYSCPKGMYWDHKQKRCINKDKDNSDNESDEDEAEDEDEDENNSWNINKLWSRDKKDKKRKENDDKKRKEKDDKKRKEEDDKKRKEEDDKKRKEENMESYNSQNIQGQDNRYILKSRIVPPVCPACPPVIACSSNKTKCPACPRPQPIQPCPPCARCPEPSFECKKVPNYRYPNANPQGLPRPLLNDFSQFT